VAQNAVATQNAYQGQPFSLAIPANTFSDPDGDTLTYTATQANGSALPAWLHLTGATFSGTPTGTEDLISIKLTAKDPGNLSATTTFDLYVGRTFNGTAASDSYTGGRGNDSVSGNAGADGLSGGAGADTIRGGDGADALNGGDGNDSLGGDAGADVLSGGTGNDSLNSGAGDDFMAGGDGADLYYFTAAGGSDTISDFALNTDHIRLSSVSVASWYNDAGGAHLVFNGANGALTLAGMSLNAPTYAQLFG
jgi:Ca2+-binding RTX toxin-like protein